MRSAAHDDGGRGLWIGLVVGVPIIAFGVRGAVLEGARTHPAELGRWIVGAAVAHDALVLPLVLLVGVGARRLVPAPAWRSVRWALSSTAVLALVSWPFVRGYGRRSDNPSLLPRDYGAGLLVVVVLVWSVAALLGWAALRRAHAGGGDEGSSLSR